MSLATHSPSSLPDAMIQVSMESEQSLPVSCLIRLPLAFTNNLNRQIQDSGSGIFANAKNVLITGGIFVVSYSCRLYEQLITVHIPEQ